ETRVTGRLAKHVVLVLGVVPVVLPGDPLPTQRLHTWLRGPVNRGAGYFDQVIQPSFEVLPHKPVARRCHHHAPSVVGELQTPPTIRLGAFRVEDNSTRTLARATSVT